MWLEAFIPLYLLTESGEKVEMPKQRFQETARRKQVFPGVVFLISKNMNTLVFILKHKSFKDIGVTWIP